MLSKKNTLIWLIAVTFCFPAMPVMSFSHGVSQYSSTGISPSYSKASPTLSEARYYDEAYVMIDCFVDRNGDTWILWWDCLYGTTEWEVVAAVDTFRQIDGISTVSIGGGGGGTPTESIGTWPTPE